MKQIITLRGQNAHFHNDNASDRQSQLRFRDHWPIYFHLQTLRLSQRSVESSAACPTMSSDKTVDDMKNII